MLWFQSVKAGHSRVLRGMNHRPATLLGDTWCPQRGGKYGPLIWTLSPFRGSLEGPLRAHVASLVGASGSQDIPGLRAQVFNLRHRFREELLKLQSMGRKRYPRPKPCKDRQYLQAHTSLTP